MTCECDRYAHGPDNPCTREAQADPDGVICLPALCTSCLWICWNDDEGF